MPRRRACELACTELDVASLREVSLEKLDNNRDKITGECYRRARHVITEIGGSDIIHHLSSLRLSLSFIITQFIIIIYPGLGRTERAADLLDRGDYRTVGQLMVDSHNSLRSRIVPYSPALNFSVVAYTLFGQ